jgi:surface protein
MQSMFIDCSALTSIPQFNVSKATSMYYTFYNCINVQTGAIELYQKAITTQYVQSRNHSATFRNCGINTQTGSAELAQIPASWK